MEFTPARGAFDIPDPWRVSILTETEDEPHLFAVPELDGRDRTLICFVALIYVIQSNP